MDAGLDTGFEGLKLHPGFFGPDAQKSLMGEIEAALRQSPPYRPRMPKTGQPWSIMQTNLGPLGWVSDEAGYRYEPRHPVTGEPWPPIPQSLYDLWAQVADYPAPPECCLINLYPEGAKMGLHQDKDEEATDAPVVSVSLGGTCLFRVGGFTRKDRTKSFRLASGDVLVLGGASRMRFHGVDRIIPGTSSLLGDSGRINLTLRRVTKA